MNNVSHIPSYLNAEHLGPWETYLVQIDRVHFGQHLTGGNRVAHIHRHAAHPPGRRRTDQVTAAGFHGADAEQRRRQRALLHLHRRHANRRQRPGAEQHPAEGAEQSQHQRGNAGATGNSGSGHHGLSWMARR